MSNPNTKNTTMALDEALDALSLSVEIIGQLGSIFHSIRKDCDENTINFRLSGAGQHIADDMWDHVNCLREDVKKLASNEGVTTHE